MAKGDPIKSIIIGFIVIAVGWVMIDSESGVDLLVDVGWIFLIGGIAVVGMSIYSVIKG